MLCYLIPIHLAPGHQGDGDFEEGCRHSEQRVRP